MNKFYPLAISLLLLAGCRSGSDHTETIVSMQMVDRNGFSETISSKERLGIYQKVDFLSSQPYEKVLRVFTKDGEGKSHSKLTTYHENGGVWQYLEALDGRANGRFLKWHENGKVKIEARVLDGMADFTELAQQNWLFDGKTSIWDDKGNLEAEFVYDKGYLEGEANYYYPDGQLQKVIPYIHGNVEGIITIYGKDGEAIESHTFKNGLREGPSTAQWEEGPSKSQEQYTAGRLIHGIYFDQDGLPVAEIENGHGIKAEFEERFLAYLTEYNNGVPDGLVKQYSTRGNLISKYLIKNGCKHGEEWQYYPDNTPKLMLTWHEDAIQGMVKTWYPNETLESQREMSSNKKQGLSFAYYVDGSLMLMEEYDNDQLVSGSYYKRGEEEPISKVEKGEGLATLYTSEGHFHSKVTYERGQPVVQ